MTFHPHAKSRRTLLRAASVSALAAYLAPLRARAAAAKPPRRIIFLAGGHGSLIDNHWPVAMPGKPSATETEWAPCESHQALAPWKDKLIYTQGLSMVSAIRDAGRDDPHLVGRGHMLVGAPLAAKGVTNAGGISIDQHIAQSLNKPMPVTKFPSLEVGIRFRRGFAPTSFSFPAAKQTLPAEWDARKLFARLFPAPDGMGKGPDRSKSVLDFVMGEYRAVAPALARADKEKLEAHLGAVRDLETRLQVAPAGGGCKGASIDDLNFTTMDGVALWNANLEAMSRMVAAAFACDLTRVASIALNDGGDGGDADIVYGTYKPGDFGTMSFHDLVHKVAMPGSAQARNPAALAAVKSAHALHAKKLARLLEVLRSTPEADGTTMLDHTAVVWVTDIGQGNHNYDKLPWVIAGSCGGAFRTGRFLRWPEGTPHNNLLVALANAMGVPGATFGDAGLCKTPLTSLTQA